MLIANGWIPSLKSAAASIPDTEETQILRIQAMEAAAGVASPNDPRWAGVEADNPIRPCSPRSSTAPPASPMRPGSRSEDRGRPERATVIIDA
jgi:hypothetical protein